MSQTRFRQIGQRALVAAGLATATAAAVMTGGVASAQAGTTLSSVTYTTAHWTTTYDWTVTKSADTTRLVLPNGQTGTVNYTVNLTKSAGTEAVYMDGQVCVTNGGDVATQGLAGTLDVQLQPSTPIVTGATLDVSAHPVLAPGETYCYPYRVDLPVAPVPGGTYKVTSNVTITNHAGHEGTPFGPSSSATDIMPANQVPVHSEVVLTDVEGGNVMTLGTFSSTPSAPITYSRTYACPNPHEVHINTAKLTYTDDGTAGPSSSVNIDVVCPPQPVTVP